MLRFKTDEGIEFPNCKRMKMKDIFVEIIDKKHPTMPVLSVQQGWVLYCVTKATVI